MDQKQVNRLILSIFVVPVMLIVLYIVLSRLVGFAFILFYEHITPVRNFHLVFYLRYAIIAGAALWMVLYAYAFVRYGEFKIGLLKIGKK